MVLRTATHRDLPAMIALLADEEVALDPHAVTVEEAHARAFEAVDADPRNELLVLDEGDGSVVAFLQVTYIPGLGGGGRERAHLEAIRVRPDRRGAGIGRELVSHAIDRARARGCGLVQLTSNKRRSDAHRFYTSIGFVRSHEGFKLRF